METNIKPLEWRKGYRDDRVTIWQASYGGLYQIRVLEGDIFVDWPNRPATRFATVGEAQEAVQTQYKADVRALQNEPCEFSSAELMRRAQCEAAGVPADAEPRP